MSYSRAVGEVSDNIVQQFIGTAEMLRLTRIDLQYSFMSHNIEQIKKKFEAAGFMVKIDSQFGSTFHITVSYVRNWAMD